MLSINDLKFSYHQKQKNNAEQSTNLEMCFNLHVNEGEILSIIGSSGSGKTTLLNLVAGFNQATSGEILIDDTDISTQPVSDRPVTTVFQDHNLFPHLDVFTNIAIGINASLKLSNEDKQHIELALSNVGLSDYTKRLPRQLSGGQRQRVALARVLVRKQKILLLDEPLAALGPAMREEIIDLMRNLVSEKKMVALFVSHQPSDSLLASERIAFIHNGQVLDIDTCDNITNHSKYPEIEDYLGNPE